MKKIIFLLFAIFTVMILTGCADSNFVAQQSYGKYGFFSGFWHGCVIFFSIIGSLFSSDIGIYAVNNTGWWYDFGFVLGLAFGLPITIYGVLVACAKP